MSLAEKAIGRPVRLLSDPVNSVPAVSRARSEHPVTDPKPIPTLDVEQVLWERGFLTLAGMDEVGRGAIAGPVTVGAAVLRPDHGPIPIGLKDSKFMTPKRRVAMVPLLHEWLLGYAIGEASPAEIDAHGIVAGLRLAGRRALDALRGPVDALILDGSFNFLAGSTKGVQFRADRPLPFVQTEVKGDARCALASAASVLAKVQRDQFMATLAEEYPHYGWERNSGYGAPIHMSAIAEHGLTPWHRTSFNISTAQAAA
jgi:ribonuclease HII